MTIAASTLESLGLEAGLCAVGVTSADPFPQARADLEHLIARRDLGHIDHPRHDVAIDQEVLPESFAWRQPVAGEHREGFGEQSAHARILRYRPETVGRRRRVATPPR